MAEQNWIQRIIGNLTGGFTRAPSENTFSLSSPSVAAGFFTRVADDYNRARPDRPGENRPPAAGTNSEIDNIHSRFLSALATQLQNPTTGPALHAHLVQAGALTVVRAQEHGQPAVTSGNEPAFVLDVARLYHAANTFGEDNATNPIRAAARQFAESLQPYGVTNMGEANTSRTIQVPGANTQSTAGSLFNFLPAILGIIGLFFGGEGGFLMLLAGIAGTVAMAYFNGGEQGAGLFGLGAATPASGTGLNNQRQNYPGHYTGLGAAPPAAPLQRVQQTIQNLGLPAGIGVGLSVTAAAVSDSVSSLNDVLSGLFPAGRQPAADRHRHFATALSAILDTSATYDGTNGRINIMTIADPADGTLAATSLNDVQSSGVSFRYDSATHRIYILASEIDSAPGGVTNGFFHNMRSSQDALRTVIAGLAPAPVPSSARPAPPAPGTPTPEQQHPVNQFVGQALGGLPAAGAAIHTWLTPRTPTPPPVDSDSVPDGSNPHDLRAPANPTPADPDFVRVNHGLPAVARDTNLQQPPRGPAIDNA